MGQLSEDTQEAQQEFPKNPHLHILKTAAIEDLPTVFLLTSDPVITSLET
jgi:hypothetical protein